MLLGVIQNVRSLRRGGGGASLKSEQKRTGGGGGGSKLGNLERTYFLNDPFLLMV